MCQPDAIRPPKWDRAAAGLVEMERLGIEFARKRLDLVRSESVAAGLDAGADDKVFEEVHTPSFATSRRANISVETMRITGVPD